VPRHLEGGLQLRRQKNKKQSFTLHLSKPDNNEENMNSILFWLIQDNRGFAESKLTDRIYPGLYNDQACSNIHNRVISYFPPFSSRQGKDD
jgi:hypothetical protein